MQAIPYDFIERTIVLCARSNEHLFLDPHKPSAFVSLSGHWGRFANRLEEETVECRLLVDLNSLLEVGYKLYRGTEIVPVEDLLKEKRTWLSYLSVVDYDAPEFHGQEKMDEKKTEMIKRLIRRSIAPTYLMIQQIPKELTSMVALLEAIPRVESLRIVNYDVKSQPVVLKEVSVVHSLVEKHVQRGCFRGLDINGNPVPKIYFPTIRLFLEHCNFDFLTLLFAHEDRDFAKEVVRLIAPSMKKRLHKFGEAMVQMHRDVLPVMKEEMGDVEEEEPGKVLLMKSDMHLLLLWLRMTKEKTFRH